MLAKPSMKLIIKMIENKNMKNKLKIYFASLLVLFFCANTSVVLAGEYSPNCSGDICAYISDDLPTGATGIDPNTVVTLTFVINNQKTSSGPVCQGSRSVFHVVRHAKAGNSADYEYLASGSGITFSYQFNSLTGGNKNRYNGIFYCWTSAVSDKSSLDVLLGTLSGQGQMWQTQEINLTTRTASPTALGAGKKYACLAGNNKYACSIGDKQNLSDVTAKDGECQYDYSDPLNVAEQIPADMCGCTKADYDAKTCKNGSVVSPGASTPPSSNPPTDKLYNPLPEEELTHMFLFIAKGFLGIVGIWAVIFIIVGGFRMVIASGDEEALTKAKKTVTWAVIGVIVAALSFSIVAIVQNLLNADIKSAQIQDKNSRNI